MAPSTAADTRVAFGHKLRDARRSKRLRQADVADALETDQKVISRAELGLTTIETQLRIAAHLGIRLIEERAS